MTRSVFQKARPVLALLLFMAATSVAQAAEKVGIVLMHGKRGTPEHVQILADDLRHDGYLVVTPDMPWSKDRAYDRTLEDAHKEIDQAFAALRAQGATRLVVAGHSMGANMAIGYAATHPDIDAVMALGPGQTVESPLFVEKLGASVSEAKALINDGKGDTPATFADLHLGKTSTVEVTPRIYLSYFDPDGLANMPKTAAKISVPFLWTVGNQDKNMLDRGPGYAFQRSGGNPLNRYAIVQSDHMGTPTASNLVVLEWLSTVFPAASTGARSGG